MICFTWFFLDHWLFSSSIREAEGMPCEGLHTRESIGRNDMAGFRPVLHMADTAHANAFFLRARVCVCVCVCA